TSGNPNLLCTNTLICSTDTKSNKTNTDSRIPSSSNGGSSKILAQPIIILLLMIIFSGLQSQ
ncbi:hypothetical protein MKW94_012195, partial [Papaver nudicaule]|nr:hypothetical protein [Papaver nudicaule]